MGELRNVAQGPDYASLKRDLSTRANAWWRDTNGQDVPYYESAYFRTNQHNK